jgi:hypothetical protein
MAYEKRVVTHNDWETYELQRNAGGVGWGV